MKENHKIEKIILANAIRALSMDAVEKAKSGHPGMPLGMADIAEVLWNDFLKHNPNNPTWINRDRFILSNGHGSMLLYSLLHLTGYKISIDDIKNFRQLNSKTPGHPELEKSYGVETTTGPLGQGLANGVGMAISEKILGEQFNKKDMKIIDHYTYVFTGDGCLMEGISHEACSLAGTLKLKKLIVFYDDNGISIDGDVKGWFTDNTPNRFKAYKWNVISDINGHDTNDISKAILEAHKSDKPTLICCKTKIGFGSPNKEGKESSHGAPLGSEEITLTKKNIGWEYEPFSIPKEIYKEWDATKKGEELENLWNEKITKYKDQYPDLYSELQRRLNSELPKDFNKLFQNYIKLLEEKSESIATRKASQITIENYANSLPELIGGSADLAASNLTTWSGSKNITEERGGNYINYGVREFGMSAIMNGISLYGGFLPYGGTFLTFSDYSRNAIRMSALMQLQNIFIFTHDSIGLGEDGPTHQPIEHINALREIPNVTVIRPCDTVETAFAWKYAIENNNGPTCLILSRQNCDYQKRDNEKIALIQKGAYVLKDSQNFDLILISTGSEVSITMQAAIELEKNNIHVRVVSMPSMEIFEKQDDLYKDSILPKECTKRIAVEAGSKTAWYKYVGLKGSIVGISNFGASAPGNTLMDYYGFTINNIIDVVKETLK